MKCESFLEMKSSVFINALKANLNKGVKNGRAY
ncbi:hypothetical protein HEHE104102_03835 [Helicobacter hepaticus]